MGADSADVTCTGLGNGARLPFDRNRPGAGGAGIGIKFDSAKIDKLCAQGSYLRQLDDCSPELVKRIVAGAKQADDLTLKLLDYLK
jgi:hypothetical protein